MGELRRELGLGYATLFGVGLILGAGIYVLIGRAAGMVGDAVWLSVAFSGLIAVSTAFSYAELSSIFTTAASTYTYVAEAFPGHQASSVHGCVDALLRRGCRRRHCRAGLLQLLHEALRAG
jgi:amino acid transporter